MQTIIIEVKKIRNSTNVSVLKEKSFSELKTDIMQTQLIILCIYFNNYSRYVLNYSLFFHNQTLYYMFQNSYEL